MPDSSASATPSGNPIADALNKSNQVKNQVQKAADDLTVVHAVLDKEIPDSERSAEVDQAVTHTNQVEKRLQDSVRVLESATKTLEEQLKKRDRRSSEGA